MEERTFRHLPKEAMKATFDAAIDEISSVQFCENNWKQARDAKKEAVEIIENLYKFLCL